MMVGLLCPVAEGAVALKWELSAVNREPCTSAPSAPTSGIPTFAGAQTQQWLS